MKIKIIKENFEKAMNEQDAQARRAEMEKIADTIRGSGIDTKAKDLTQGLKDTRTLDQERMLEELTKIYLAGAKIRIAEQLSKLSPEQIEQLYRQAQGLIPGTKL